MKSGTLPHDGWLLFVMLAFIPGHNIWVHREKLEPFSYAAYVIVDWIGLN